MELLTFVYRTGTKLIFFLPLLITTDKKISSFLTSSSICEVVNSDDASLLPTQPSPGCCGQPTVSGPRYTDPQTVRRLYELARRISQVFSAGGLRYWTTGGTTLGIVRHGGLIPWDDDLDFCIIDKVGRSHLDPRQLKQQFSLTVNC